MRKVLVSCFILLAAFSLSAHAQTKTLIAAADPWPPFADDKSPTEGLALEITRAAFATQGYEVQMVFVPWARAISGTRDGTYDIIPTIWKSAERQEHFYYGEPFIDNNIKLIKRVDDDFSYTGLESLAGKTVGTIAGYSYTDDFATSSLFTRDEVSDFMTNVHKLVAGKIDLAIEDEVVARSRIVTEDPALMEKIEFVDPPLSSNGLHVVVGLVHPNHKEIIAAYNAGLAAIKASGAYDEILQKYGLGK